MAIKQESVGRQETVYAAIELSKKTWVLGIALPDRDRPSIHRVAGAQLDRKGQWHLDVDPNPLQVGNGCCPCGATTSTRADARDCHCRGQ